MSDKTTRVIGRSVARRLNVLGLKEEILVASEELVVMGQLAKPASIYLAL